MSGYPPPWFHPGFLEEKVFEGTGTAEGQSSVMAKSSGLVGPLPGGGGEPSRPENSERTSGTGLSGKVAESLGSLAGSVGPRKRRHRRRGRQDQRKGGWVLQPILGGFLEKPGWRLAGMNATNARVVIIVLTVQRGKDLGRGQRRARNGNVLVRPGKHWTENRLREELNSWKTLKSLLDWRRQLLYSKEMFYTIEWQLKDGLNFFRTEDVFFRKENFEDVFFRKGNFFPNWGRFFLFGVASKGGFVI